MLVSVSKDNEPKTQIGIRVDSDAAHILQQEAVQLGISRTTLATIAVMRYVAELKSMS